MIVLHETALINRVQTIRTVASMARVNPEILQHNPLGKIPVLLTADQGPIYDSPVICEYLDGLQHRTRLFPADPVERIVALRRQALGDGLLDVLLLLRNEKGRPDGAPSPTYIAGFEQKVAAALATLETETPALTKSAFGIGHIAIGCALGYLDFRFSDRNWRSAHPALAGWLAKFEARPSSRATVPGDEAAV